MKLKNMNVVTCPPCGESTLKGGKGVVNKDTLMDTPPSALRATSKAEKLFDNPPTPLRGTSPARGAEKAALCAKHPAGGEVNGGFTLIELLVVVLIIGILAAVAVPQYQVAVKKTNLSRFIPLVNAIYNAQQAYYLANGKYSTSLDLLDIDITIPADCTRKTSKTSDVYSCTEFYAGIPNSDDSVEGGTANLHYLKRLKDKTYNGYTFHKGESYCYAKGTIAIRTCQALGGIDTQIASDKNWEKRFLLP